MTAEIAPKPVVRLAVKCVTAVLLANVLLIYVPPSALALGGILAVAAASLLVDYRKILTLTLSLVILTLVLELIVRWGGFDALTPYFRPHELMALETSYRPNERVEMDVPHGDLLMIDPALPRSLAEPRHEVFVTDSLGYRNDADYSGERLILVGDSFLVGTDTFPASRLRTVYKIPAYNISFSGMGPLIYAEKVQWARRNLTQECCIVLFFFEGNDFQSVNPAEAAVREKLPRGIQRFAKGYVKAVRNRSEWSKTFFGLMSRARETVMPDRPESERPHDGSDKVPVKPKTFVRNVGGKPMAFLGGYADVAHRRSFDDHGFVRSRLLSAAPDMVVFIPDKYRVYASLFDENPETALPHAQWDYLKKAADEFGFPVIDLTEQLISRSKQLLGNGAVTYWRDDTHWTQHGETVAIEALVAALKSSDDANCLRAVGR